MFMHTTGRRSAAFAVIMAPLMLGACAQDSGPDVEETETTKVIGVEDVGGGELQVADPKPGEVPVDLPETPMKNVPDAPDAEEGEAAPPPTAGQSRN